MYVRTHRVGFGPTFSGSLATAAAAALAAATLVAGCNSDSNRDAAVEALPDVSIADAGAADGSGAMDAATGLDVRVVNCDGEDDASPNHTPPTAADAGVSGFAERDGFLCAGFDDWYVLEASPGERIRARLDLATQTGNLDLYLFRRGATGSTDDALRASATTEREEQLQFTVDEAGEYLLNVRGNAEASGTYTVSFYASCAGASDCADGERCSLVQQRCVEDVPAACGTDALEPNDGPDTATPATFGGDGFAFEHGYEVCPEDVDLFSVDLEETTSLFVDLAWTDNTNLGVVLYDEIGLVAGAGVTDDEQPERIDGAFLAPGRYYVAVIADEVNAAASTFYNLTLERRAGACESDADCGGVVGRQQCVDGACSAFEPAQPGPAGAPCDDGGDCVEGLGCYQGVDGFGDNFCTQVCQSDEECGFFGRGAQCVPTSGSAVCVGACEADEDCPTYYSCDDGACDVDECDVDADCGAGRVCRRSEQQNNGYCTATAFPGCRDDDAFEPNDTDGGAVLLEGTAEGLICEANDDWFVYEVERDGATLEVELQFAGADLDLFVFDEFGAEIATGATEAVPEVATAEYVPAGRYLIRVNHFPSEVTSSVRYTLSATETRGSCESDADCADLEPLRIVCDEDAGACRFFEGNGEVEPGGTCDSSDDCDGQSEFCWTFEPASEERNICTVRCNSNNDCDDLDGTSCRQFGRGFAVCLP